MNDYSNEIRAACLHLLNTDQPPELLFHYTSAEACFSILDHPVQNGPIVSSQGPRLWASSALAMNDALEIHYGFDVIHKVAKKFAPQGVIARSFMPDMQQPEKYVWASQFEGSCVACFCQNPDLLSQWRAYGRNATGYSLGFRTDVISKDAANFQLLKVVYDRVEQTRIVENLFQRVRTIIERDRVAPEEAIWQKAVDIAVNFSLAFKHASFSEEQEWRLVFPRPHPSMIKYRSGRRGIIPYREIRLSNQCLACIWQGPTLDHDVDARTLEMYIRSRYGVRESGEPAVQIHRSDIPLRKLEP